jgi:hypothetical protein
MQATTRKKNEMIPRKNKTPNQARRLSFLEDFLNPKKNEGDREDMLTKEG